MLLGGSPFLLSLREQQGAQSLRTELVDADDGLREVGGELTTGDEVLGFFHHHPHLLEVIAGDAVETARVDDEHGALHADAGHTEDLLVRRAVDVDREELRMP